MAINKAVILAGGIGSRLRPITADIPKPLVPIVGVPIIKRLIKRASELGITKASLATMYLSEKIKRELGDSLYGVSLYYVHETEPIGTAGGALFAYEAICDSTDESVLVLSGDGIWDFDLRDAFRFHFEKNADVTIVSVRTDNPTEYGIINTTNEGEIAHFSEKPIWSRVVSDKVNTGIYIMKVSALREIPKGENYDFSKNLFPKLLSKSFRMFAYEADGYWCDVGDAQSYYRCNIDALKGKIKDFDFHGALSGEELFYNGVSYHTPIWVSRRAAISKGVYISPYTVIGDDCVISDNCEIRESIIHGNVSVGENSMVIHAIICENVRIGKNVQIKSGVVIGANTTIADDTIVPEGAIISSCLCVDKSNASQKAFAKANPFDDSEHGYICRKTSDALSLGEAIAYAVNSQCIMHYGLSGRVGVLCEGNYDNHLYAEAILCGLRGSGLKTFFYGDGFEAEALFVSASFLNDALIYIKEHQEGIEVVVYDRFAKSFSEEFKRNIRDYSRIKNEKIIDGKDNEKSVRETERVNGLRFIYYNSLIISVEDSLSNKDAKLSEVLKGMNIAFENGVEKFSPNHMLYRAVIELGGKVLNDSKDECVLVSIDNDGLNCSITENNVRADMKHITAIIISRENEAVAVPYLSPRAYRRSAKTKNVLEYLSDGYSSSRISRKRMRECLWVRDSVFALLRLLCIMKEENKSLGELLNEIPTFELSVRWIDGKAFEKDMRAKIMSRLAELADFSQGILREGEGIELVFDNGQVTVIPGVKGGFRLIGEALNAEMAKDLCDDVEKKIYDLAKGRIKS